MRLEIRLFAAARAAVDADHITLDVPAGATIGKLRETLATSHPALSAILSHSRIAMNQEYATDGMTILDDAELAVIPPVSGG